ncbi:hypothetical protein [Saccharicrinis aurantiacus]|uniref:hypothetical protein n=1 Tax=Saccharicrinis aurantiacus TaxID=1849719 RepID=UPI000837EC6F|nr:hypothetical protein [Saccharicrinis aurantiacus]
MKRIFSIFLILIVAIGTFKHATIFLSFKLNQDYIAKNLCIEKDIEESSCKGCCQLKKKQNQQKETDKQNIPNQKKDFNIDLFYTKIISISSMCKDSLHTWIEINNYYNYIRFHSLFRPPQMA